MVQSVHRALQLLKCLELYPKGAGVTALSEELALPKSTVHRLLRSLEEEGMVRRTADQEHYLLGLHLLQLASAVQESLDLRSAAQEHLEALAEQTGEVVHLCVQEGTEVVYIDKVESRHTLRMYSRIGKRAPMHCTGVGKALLAAGDAEVVDRVIKNGLTSFTPATITTGESFRQELKQIAGEGVSFDREEHEEGIQCAAAVIEDAEGRPLGAVSVSGPVSRVTTERLENELAPLIRQTAAGISASLGKTTFG
ncbi:IclR family transcriptional regulator [Alkalicoccus urumqiensis]|uniref:Glycerol operon regulatory protein n=1 Tax=Alkalicoccus urumqiensis TaxID=1548213 RepID=A0A2P6MJ75_ALKUR|nr:IclR family transcriptional regulator [Alkalicoccus urumqiensis]PRO66310.1 IclR family transcriptional regulator [Alkalicoccus urumqiensis]